MHLLVFWCVSGLSVALEWSPRPCNRQCDLSGWCPRQTSARNPLLLRFPFLVLFSAYGVGFVCFAWFQLQGCVNAGWFFLGWLRYQSGFHFGFALVDFPLLFGVAPTSIHEAWLAEDAPPSPFWSVSTLLECCVFTVMSASVACFSKDFYS